MASLIKIDKIVLKESNYDIQFFRQKLAIMHIYLFYITNQTFLDMSANIVLLAKDYVWSKFSCLLSLNLILLFQTNIFDIAMAMEKRYFVDKCCKGQKL